MAGFDKVLRRFKMVRYWFSEVLEPLPNSKEYPYRAPVGIYRRPDDLSRHGRGCRFKTTSGCQGGGWLLQVVMCLLEVVLGMLAVWVWLELVDVILTLKARRQGRTAWAEGPWRSQIFVGFPRILVFLAAPDTGDVVA